MTLFHGSEEIMNMSYSYTNSLYHHGIKGQRWGIRRYQNEDGSYTNIGRKRHAEDARDGTTETAKTTENNSENTKHKKMSRNAKIALGVIGAAAAIGVTAYTVKKGREISLGRKQLLVMQNVMAQSVAKEKLLNSKLEKAKAIGDEDYINSIKRSININKQHAETAKSNYDELMKKSYNRRFMKKNASKLISKGKLQVADDSFYDDLNKRSNGQNHIKKYANKAASNLGYAIGKAKGNYNKATNKAATNLGYTVGKAKGNYNRVTNKAASNLGYAIGKAKGNYNKATNKAATNLGYTVGKAKNNYNRNVAKIRSNVTNTKNNITSNGKNAAKFAADKAIQYAVDNQMNHIREKREYKKQQKQNRKYNTRRVQYE